MNKFFSLLTGLVIAASTCHAQLSVTAALIHHNIHSGGQAQEAADHIVDLLEMNPQKGLVLLNEANYAREFFTLPYSGWQHFWPGSPHEGRGNPIFTRVAAATVLTTWKLEMEEEWTHLQPKDPRVYTVVKCQLVNNPWVQFHVVNVHFPTNRAANDIARQESIDRLIQLSEVQSALPLIICGDFNMGVAEARRRIANVIGGRIHSDASVDHMIVRDGRDVAISENLTVERLGQFGSDHQAIRYNFTFTQLEASTEVSDWNLY